MYAKYRIIYSSWPYIRISFSLKNLAFWKARYTLRSSWVGQRLTRFWQYFKAITIAAQTITFRIGFLSSIGSRRTNILVPPPPLIGNSLQVRFPISGNDWMRLFPVSRSGLFEKWNVTFCSTRWPFGFYIQEWWISMSIARISLPTILNASLLNWTRLLPQKTSTAYLSCYNLHQKEVR